MITSLTAVSSSAGAAKLKTSALWCNQEELEVFEPMIFHHDLSVDLLAPCHETTTPL